MKKIKSAAAVLILLFIFASLAGCASDKPKAETEEAAVMTAGETETSLPVQTGNETETAPAIPSAAEQTEFDYASVPGYSGVPYAVIDENIPGFADEDLTDVDYEYYSELDELGRCGVCTACVGRDLMPTEERGSIGQIKPSGWHTVKYDIVDGKYLYNRCHLIAYQIAGENANVNNLITGTRYMNKEGMLPFENMVADYVKETGCHVLYRSCPVFIDDELLARGVHIEAYSVEDDGEGISFNVFCYNVQPGIEIDYATGESCQTESPVTDSTDAAATEDVAVIPEESASQDKDRSGPDETEYKYVLNTNTKKFHYPDCDSVDQMADKNKEFSNDSRDDIIASGYSPCKRCNP